MHKSRDNHLLCRFQLLKTQVQRAIYPRYHPVIHYGRVFRCGHARRTRSMRNYNTKNTTSVHYHNVKLTHIAAFVLGHGTSKSMNILRTLENATVTGEWTGGTQSEVNRQELCVHSVRQVRRTHALIY